MQAISWALTAPEAGLSRRQGDRSVPGALSKLMLKRGHSPSQLRSVDYKRCRQYCCLVTAGSFFGDSNYKRLFRESQIYIKPCVPLEDILSGTIAKELFMSISIKQDEIAWNIYQSLYPGAELGPELPKCFAMWWAGPWKSKDYANKNSAAIRHSVSALTAGSPEVAATRTAWSGALSSAEQVEQSSYLDTKPGSDFLTLSMRVEEVRSSVCLSDLLKLSISKETFQVSEESYLPNGQDSQATRTFLQWHQYWMWNQIPELAALCIKDE